MSAGSPPFRRQGPAELRVALEVLRFRPIAMLVAAALAFAALARININELIFHPTGRSSPRACPIRSISYHHVVNDRLGGVPIVATY